MITLSVQAEPHIAAQIGGGVNLPYPFTCSGRGCYRHIQPVAGFSLNTESRPITYWRFHTHLGIGSEHIPGESVAMPLARYMH